MRKLAICFGVVGLLTVFSSQSLGFSLYRICQNNDTIQLNFNPLKDTCQSFISYQIFWKKNANQDFQVIDTVKDASKVQYIHTPGNLNNLEDWQYLIKATVDCNPRRVRFTDSLKVDKKRPSSIELDSISVEGPSAVRLGWSPHPDSSIKGYTIYYVDGGQTRKLDQVFGHKNTSYVEDSLSEPNGNREKFRIGAFDSCGNESAVSPTVHRSILLEKPSVDTCAGTIDLNWSAYQGFEVGNYVVVAIPENGKELIADTVPGGKTSTTVDGLPGGAVYDLIVRAQETGGDATSSSNKRKVRLGAANDLGFVYIRSASVVDSQVKIDAVVEKVAGLKSIRILRGTDSGDLQPFKTISPVNQKEITVVDSISNPQRQPYFYRVEGQGLCKEKAIRSNIVRTIHLREKTIEDSIQMRWNAYVGFNGGVKTYLVQKQTRGGDAERWIDVEKLRGDKLTYRKLNEFKDSDEDRACFRVKGLEGSGNEFGFQASSFSNVVCLISDAVVFVPDAIVVNGLNNVFKPKGAFINKAQSTMTIYNRWGEKVFQSDNLKEGWDARYNGEIVDQGVYLYQLTIVGINQETSTRKGTFKVIR